MFNWFKPKSPLKPGQIRWIDTRFDWLREEFGDERLAGTVVTPTDEFFPDRYTGAHEDASVILEHVCTYMGVDRARLELKLYRSASADTVSSAFNPTSSRSYALGAFSQGSDTIEIWLEATNLNDPCSVVATLAHELGHVHLLADGRCDPTAKDHEPLTDLLVVFFGLGIFTANSALRDANWRMGHFSGWQISRQGYLSQDELAYALALYAHLRNEYEPKWAAHLRKDVRALFKTELKQLVDRGRTRFAADEAHPAETAPPDDMEEICEKKCRDEEPCSCEQPDDESEDSDDSLSSHHRRDADEAFECGIACMASGEYEQAIESFTRTIALTPKDEEAWSQRARAYMKMGKWAEAIEDCTNALQIEPNDIETICQRATAYTWLGKYNEAIDDVEDAVREEPKNSWAWFVRGIADIGLGLQTQAVRNLSKAIRYSPKVGDYYLARSKAYQNLGDTKHAQEDLVLATFYSPELADESRRATRLAGRV